MSKVMPWGRYKDQPLTDIESSYLAWVLEKCDHVAPALAGAITAELRSRFGPPPPPRGLRHACPDPTLAVDIVSAGLKVLARRHHPDTGGDTHTMQQLNATADWLKARVS
jgi:hypothetical protein